MDSESVGSNLPSPLFANPNQHQQQQSIEPLRNNLQNPLPISQRSQRDTCFYCKKLGHWSINCPEKQKTLVNKQMTTTSSPSPTTPSSGGGAITIPDMQCPCGGGLCYILTSKTEKNPGRQFYKCPRRSACSFFLWCDEHSSDQGVEVAVIPYPMCSCGAGTCNRHKVMKESINKGRFFFVCPVTKGQGACNFFQWEDEIKQSAQSTLAVKESPEMAEKTVKHGAYGRYGNEMKESISPGSVVRGSESPLRKEYPVKEREVGRSHSGGVDEKILSPMRNLRLSEERSNNNTSPVAKPGQWIKECFKCGETGHWMKDCTA